jgi:dCMP deaminase
MMVSLSYARNCYKVVVMSYSHAVQFMQLAFRIALRSPDPTTQNGAVITDGQFTIYPAAVGCNEFTRGLDVGPLHMERPLKYSYIEHAERNAIYAAAKAGIATHEKVLVCPWLACSDCARAIVQSGIKHCITLERVADGVADRWADSVAIGDDILAAGNVSVQFLPIEPFIGMTPLRRGGQLWPTAPHGE